MINFAVLGQDFLIIRKRLLLCACLQLASLLIACILRGAGLAGAPDLFFDTLPVVVIPGILELVLTYAAVCRQREDSTLELTLATGISPGQVMSTKILLLLFVSLAFYAFSMLIGCAGQVYGRGSAWNQDTYILLNLGGLCLQIFIGGWCFLIACARERAGLSFYAKAAAAVVVLEYVLSLLNGWFPELFFLRYLTFFTLFSQQLFAAGSPLMLLVSLLFAAIGILFYLAGRYVFCRRTLRF